MKALPATLTGHQSWHSLDGVDWQRKPAPFVLIEPPTYGGYWYQAGRRREGSEVHVTYMSVHVRVGVSWWQTVETIEGTQNK